MYEFRLGRPSYIARVKNEYSRGDTAENATTLGSLSSKADATADGLSESAQAGPEYRRCKLGDTADEG